MKKLLGLLSVVAIAATGAAIAVGCSDKGKDNILPGQLSYEIKVTSVGGIPLEGVTVSAYSGETVVKSSQTNESGVVTYNMAPGEYEVKVSDLPKGYFELEGVTYKTDDKATPLNIYLQSSVIKEEMPVNTRYNVGDIMYDFTVTLSDGTEFNLAEELETKKMVLINFWATWCSPCKAEFPYMNTAYNSYKDDVSIVALSSYDSSKDIAAFKAENNLSFDMAADPGICNYFAAYTGSIPLSVVIDRYGVVAWAHTGNMITVKDFTDLFDKYISDDYVQDVPDSGNGGGDDDDTPTIEPIVLPDVQAPSSADIEKAINTGTFPFSYYFDEEDEYAWPWVVSSDGKSVYAANKQHGEYSIRNSYAILLSDITVNAGDVFAFDYKVSTEQDADILYFQVDGVIIHTFSGEDSGTSFGYVFEKPGAHTLTFIYMKDSTTVAGEDLAQISNMRLCKESDINVSTDIKRYAATESNSAYTETNREKKYNSYIVPVFNENDGYYHVGSADGPLLMADPYYATPWSSTESIATLGYSGQCVFEGFDYSDLAYDYAVVAMNTELGLYPVDKELHFLLTLMCEYLGDEKGYEEEWLEFCVYYDHYGPGSGIENPILGYTRKAALPLTVGLNDIVIDRPVRGMYYQFTPESSGIYVIESLGTMGTSVWIEDENGNMLESSDEKMIITDDGKVEYDPENCFFVMSLSAGKTYYFYCGFFDTMGKTGTYQLSITQDNDYRYFNFAAKLPHIGYGEGNLWLECIDVAKDSEGYYHWLKEDGTLGSYVYLSFIHTTQVVTSHSLSQLIDLDNPDYNFDFSKLQKLDGSYYEDYTEIITTYRDLALSEQDDAPYGFVKVNDELKDILNIFAMCHTFRCDQNWLLFCYYYQFNAPEYALGGTNG